MLESVGYSVYSWSSVANNDEYAYYLIAFSDGNVYPGDSLNRDNGNVVRCVVR